ncbi:hypothetical protein [Streptomyces sp. NPDC002343]
MQLDVLSASGLLAHDTPHAGWESELPRALDRAARRAPLWSGSRAHPTARRPGIFALAASLHASVLINKPLAQGLLTGKYDPDRPPTFSPGDHRLRKARSSPRRAEDHPGRPGAAAAALRRQHDGADPSRPALLPEQQTDNATGKEPAFVREGSRPVHPPAEPDVPAQPRHPRPSGR